MWRQLAREDATCTFFQTPDWLQVTAGFERAHVHPLLFEWPSVRAALPLLKRRRLVGDRYFSPFGTYSGLIAASALTAEQLAEAAGYLLRGSVQLVNNPFSQNVILLQESLADFTSAVFLEGRKEESVLADWERDARRMARLGEKNEVRVRMAAGESDIKAYDGVYQRTLDRWAGSARSVYPSAFFRELWKKLGDGPSMRLWLAEREGVVEGGCFAFYHNRHAVLWHGATTPRSYSLGVTQLLYREIMLDALRRGFAICDFNPSSGLAGVRAFKKSLGTREINVSVQISRSPLSQVMHKVRELLPSRP